MAVITLQNPTMLLAVPALALLFLLLAWRRRSIASGVLLLRLAIGISTILALAQPVRSMSATTAEPDAQGRLVILADQSASLGDRRTLVRSVATRLAQLSPENALLWFADRPVLSDSGRSIDANASEIEIATENEIDTEMWDAGDDPMLLRLDPDATDLADAISLGTELLKGEPGRLVLLSDGVPTTGDTARAVDRLIQQHVPVDVFTVETQDSEHDVRVVNLSLPPRLRQGESFSVDITLHTGRPGDAGLTLSQDGAQVAQDVLALQAGVNLFKFEVGAGEIGPHTFRVEVTPDVGLDDQPVNNTLSAFTQVFPPPQILVVLNDLVQDRGFVHLMQEAGFAPRTVLPADLASRLSELEPFAGMVLLDVSARELQLDQMIAVQEFVRSLGRGLLVTGGRNSYSLGEYQDTVLAELLPVSLEPPPREERPPVALLLIVDHSGSMLGSNPTKLTMAKEAAIRATDILGPEDLIGVLMFDHRFEWVVPFQQVSDGADLLTLQQKVAGIPRGGGTRILPALETGLAALAGQDVTSGARHAVLLTDGQSFDGPNADEQYNGLVDAARQAGITLSTIAIGSDADARLLSRLAERGHGRYHFADAPEELPALTIAESAILSGNALQEGDFVPAISMPHPILRGLFPGAAGAQTTLLPSLRGYIALTPKPRAETVLQVGPGDPLLSVWGYGLGRVAAWTSDAWSNWAVDWPAWTGAERFWGQVAAYTLPAPHLGLLQLAAEIESDGVVTLTADAFAASGQPVDLARTSGELTTPTGQDVQLNLLQTAPGRYQQRVRLPDRGAYLFRVSQQRSSAAAESAVIGFVVPYPAEYALPEDGAGPALLREIAAVTGGRELRLDQLTQSYVGMDTGHYVPVEPVPLWPWLLLVALVLWPIEIAARRRARVRIR